MKKKWMKILVLSLGILLCTCFLSGCDLGGETLSPTPGENVDLESLWVRVTGVQVQEGEMIEFSGEANLPENSCLYTQLYADDRLLSWWPVEKCFPVSGQEWQFSVTLGEAGAQDELEPGVQYLLKVYWPGAPEEVMATFNFDITPPPSP